MSEMDLSKSYDGISAYAWDWMGADTPTFRRDSDHAGLDGFD